MTKPGVAAAPLASSLSSPRQVMAAALLAGAAATLLAVVGAKALAPPGYFTKYLEAARASEEVRRARAADYSPLYLELARAVVPHWGARGLLVGNVAAHAATCAAIAAVVALAVGWGWGLVTGLVAAAYRPFLVYTAVLEPEAVLLALLSWALLAGVLARRVEQAPRWPAALASTAGIALGLAGLARPAYVVLVPAWAVWLAWREGRPRHWRIASVLVAGAAVVVIPALVHRWVQTGTVMLMNPGPVFYEGNGPQALGAPGVPPELAKMLEARGGAGGDWAHEAYRRLAAAAGRDPNVAANNRYWWALAWEYLGTDAKISTGRLLAKAGYALGPYEFHDLPEAEELDRRLRRALPWGFGVLAAALLVSLPGWGRALPVMAGAAAVGMLSLAVQVAFYASARQRLPLALAILVLAPVALSCCAGRPRRQLVLAGLAAAVVTAALAWHTAPLASLRHAQLSTLLGPAPPAPLAEWLDSRAWRPAAAVAAQRVVLAGQLPVPVEAEVLEEYLAPALATDVPWLRGRARWQLARHHAARGSYSSAVLLACQAATEAPQLVQAAALCAAGRRGRADDGDLASWRPAGVDPVSARFALARAMVALGQRDAGAILAQPVLGLFPELAADLYQP